MRTALALLMPMIAAGQLKEHAEPQMPADFDCAMRKLAAEYGEKLIPEAKSILFDAFELGTLCNETAPVSMKRLRWRHASPRPMAAGATFYVNPETGDDVNGTGRLQDDALRTIHEGVRRCRMWRAKRASTIPPTCVIHLAMGKTFELSEPILLSTTDSYTHITADTLADGSSPAPVISGGVTLTGLKWSPAGAPFPAGVVKTLIPETGQQFDFTQLFVDNQRAVRARAPNANPGGYYTTGIWQNNTGWSPNAKQWLRTDPSVHAERNVTKTLRNTTRYSDFLLGYGGPVKEFSPPAAYWAVDHPPAGGGCKYEVPSGLVFDPTIFAPALSPADWNVSNMSRAIVHAFHKSYWGDWAFAVSSVDKQKNTIHFSRGGFQEARGSCGKGGHDFYVENVKELLDVPDEWFLDTSTTPYTLFYFPNTTISETSAVQAAAESTFVASKLSTLVELKGDTPAKPIVSSSVSNVKLMFAASTFMEPYEVPSAGDWSIHRGAAVELENTQDASVDSCVLEQVGGNGVLVSRYNRNARVVNNEMVRLGDSGVVVVGDLKYETDSPWDHSIDGQYPVNTTVQGNLIHELGLFTKQTAGFFQALASTTIVAGNIVLNGPRSGLNFNDAAFGGNDIRENLLANLVRETVDHGPYNSWDRNPYLFRTDVDDAGAAPTSTPLMSSVHHNFIYCSYGGIKGIDHDDGSGYYDDHSNYLPLCTGKMKGETQIVRQNVYLFPRWTSCFKSMGGMQEDSPMVFEDNKCVNLSPNIYSSCDYDHGNQILANNTLYVAGAVTDPATGVVTIKGFPCEHGNFSKWVQKGQDVGSTVSGNIPSTATMVSWGRDLLWT